MYRVILILFFLTSCVQNKWPINKKEQIQIYHKFQNYDQMIVFELILETSKIKVKKANNDKDFNKNLFLENLLKSQVDIICDIKPNARPKIKDIFLKDLKPTIALNNGMLIFDCESVKILLNKKIKEKLINSGFLAYIQLGELYTNVVGEIEIGKDQM